MTQVNVSPDHYVLLCARQFVAMASSLRSVTSAEEKRQHRARMDYFMESGMLEVKCERERRQRSFPGDFRKALIEKDGSIVSRPISREEAELLRFAYSIPPVASLEDLSADDMQNLADMFEGWAQSDLTDSVNVARLHGWADGVRSLAEIAGADYAPPEAPPGATVSLMSFMARRMRRSSS